VIRALSCAALSCLALPLAASLSEAATPVPSPPLVNVRAYILVDHFSSRVLGAYHADQRVEPASLTKLMTAYVVFAALAEQRLKLTDLVTISQHAWRAEGSRSFVKVGAAVPVDILIKGMIVQSGNDATIALAERLGGTEGQFVDLMNRRAQQLGMQASHFANSDGLPDPNHYTSARDMARLADALIRDFPEYYPLFSIREFQWENIRQSNRNGLLGRDPSVDGLKTGHTESAGWCLVSSANRNGMRLVSVVMGAPNDRLRDEASATLLNYGYTFYETVHVKAAHETVLKPRVWESANEFVAVGPPYEVYATVTRGEGAGLKTSAHLNTEPLIAPLTAGQIVGELTVESAGGEVIARTPLVPATDAPLGSLWTRAFDSVALWFH